MWFYRIGILVFGVASCVLAQSLVDVGESNWALKSELRKTASAISTSNHASVACMATLDVCRGVLDRNEKRLDFAMSRLVKLQHKKQRLRKVVVAHE